MRGITEIASQFIEEVRSNICLAGLQLNYGKCLLLWIRRLIHFAGNEHPAERFFKRLLRKHKGEPRKIITDKLRSYNVAHRELIPESFHDTRQYMDNGAELSHEPTRVRGRGMRKFKSMHQAQRFLGGYAAVYNLFNLGRHLVSAEKYRYFRLRSFATWVKAAAIQQ